MKHFTRDYYVYNNELYKKIKPQRQGYRLINKDGNRKWITIAQIIDIINKK